MAATVARMTKHELKEIIESIQTRFCAEENSQGSVASPTKKPQVNAVSH